MNMKKLGLLAALALASTASFADTSFRVRGGYTFGDYELSSDVQPLYDAEYTGVPLGLTLIFDNGMYADVLVSNVSGDANGDDTDETGDFDRDDTTLTFGWRVENFSFFVGYKKGESTTEFEFAPGFSAADTFESEGVVAGAGISFPSGSHNFSITGGLGFMEGTYTYEETGSPDFDVDADFTLGYSLGLAYSYSFNSNFAITADYKWQSYDFEFSDFDITLTEDFSGFSLLAGYRF